jgi:hypothetical protein
VYNVKKEQVRTVLITPSDDWGQPEQGLIGAEVLMSLLNQIPKRSLDN